MKNFAEDFKNIYHSERGIIFLMILNLVLAIALLVFSIIHLNPGSTVVKIGYGDIGGYRDGTWFDMIAFPILAVVFGVLHSFLALRVYEKRGGGMAKFFLVITTTLILGAFLVLVRLLGEG